jgi:hypothetical protein
MRILTIEHIGKQEYYRIKKRRDIVRLYGHPLPKKFVRIELLYQIASKLTR